MPKHRSSRLALAMLAARCDAFAPPSRVTGVAAIGHSAARRTLVACMADEDSEEGAQMAGSALEGAASPAAEEVAPNFGIDFGQPAFIGLGIFILLNLVALAGPNLLPWQQSS